MTILIVKPPYWTKALKFLCWSGQPCFWVEALIRQFRKIQLQLFWVILFLTSVETVWAWSTTSWQLIVEIKVSLGIGKGAMIIKWQRQEKELLPIDALSTDLESSCMRQTGSHGNFRQAQWGFLWLSVYTLTAALCLCLLAIAAKWVILHKYECQHCGEPELNFN